MQRHRRILLTGARVVQPFRTLENGDVLIEDASITHVDKAGFRVRGPKEVIELKSFTLFPGFIDVHIHGATGVDTLEASTADLERVSGFLATQGVTGWVPTLVPAAPELYQRALQSIREAAIQPQQLSSAKLRTEREAPASIGARVLGVHYEGPFVNESQCGALRREHLRTFVGPADVEQLPLANDGAVKMMTLAPEIAGGIALVAELEKRNWVVSIGHTRADVATLDRALSAGARHMTHFMNAMAPLHHRAPGPIGWGLLHDDVTCDFIADGIHLDPLMLRLLLRTKGAPRLSLISDAIAAAGMGDGSYHIWDEVIQVEHGRTRNARGSIAGSVISMLDAARKMRSLGATDVELAQMGALNPAKLLRLDSECGSIETGKRADLVAIDEGGNVKLTIIGGEVAFSQL
jgi:N-acetylglucosamine-6-phosphate deacetylase